MQSSESETVIRLPAPASAPPTPRIPVVAALAPVVVSLGLFAITGSPMTLLFAILGPVTAIAGVADGAIGGRRHVRRERARLHREVSSTADAIRLAQTAELGHRRAAAPSGAVIARDDPRGRLRWHAPPESMVVTIGDGAVRSGIRVDGVVDGDEVSALAAAAATLPEAPVMADPSRGIGIVGPLPLARAVARGVAIQLIAATPPADGRISVAGPAFAGAVERLPHGQDALEAGSADSVLVIRASGGPAVRAGIGGTDVLARVEVADEAVSVAAVCDTVVTIDPDGARVTRAGRAGDAPITVHPVDAESLASWCEAAARWAPRAASAASAAVPRSVGFAEVIDARGTGPTDGVLGRGADGPVTVELARHGPHAVVGGTTGSGKSELLVTWVASMAAGAPPADLAILLIDFKGGAGFAPIARLPHVVGVVTDLDAAGAMRAVGSLRAELRRRETALATAGLREHSPALGIPRLVIVVDEYAALVDLDAQLHALFGDIAARGRSLGVHLVVGTQRPAASVRDAVLANADIRVSLRVRDRADGIALVGSARPADLPAEPRGRAIASIGGAEPVELQVAMTDPGSIERIVDRWSGEPRQPRPWCDPLPPALSPSVLHTILATGAPVDRSATAGVIGALDRPDLQRILPWTWDPQRDGVLLAVGAAGCGRSGLLAAIGAAGPSIRIVPEPPAAWDALAELVDAAGDHGGTTLLIDDLDLVLDRFDPEHRQVWLERLVSACRRRRELGIGVAITTVSLDGSARAIEPHVSTRVLMRMPSRQEHRLAGGDAETWDPALPPGGAIVDGIRAQVLAPATDPSGAGRAPARSVSTGRIRSTPLGAGLVAVVCGDPESVSTTLRAAGRTIETPTSALRLLEGAVRGGIGLPPRTAIVGDAAAWQARWDALETIGRHASVLVHGLPIAQVRVITGRRELPPPLPDGDRWCWMLTPGRILRTRLPDGAS